jgi:hypothetical protein
MHHRALLCSGATGSPFSGISSLPLRKTRSKIRERDRKDEKKLVTARKSGRWKPLKAVSALLVGHIKAVQQYPREEQDHTSHAIQVRRFDLGK